MTSKKEEAPKYFRVKNGGDFIMLTTKGSAFLYPGMEAVVSDLSEEDKKRLIGLGAEVVDISEAEYSGLAAQSGILGIIK